MTFLFDWEASIAHGQSSFHINFILDWEIGAGEGIRTLDPDLGKVVLYP